MLSSSNHLSTDMHGIYMYNMHHISYTCNADFAVITKIQKHGKVLSNQHGILHITSLVILLYLVTGISPTNVYKCKITDPEIQLACT